MAKSRDAFRTISEVAEHLDTPAHVLRFWESKFTQIRPVKRAGGRRYYRPEDVALLEGIRKLLHDDGMTIKGVQKILREQGVKAVMALGPTADTQADPAPAAPAATPDDQIVDEAPYAEVEVPPQQDNVVQFTLDQPAHQPGLFDTDAPTPERPILPPRAIAYAVAATPEALAARRADLAPLMDQLKTLHEKLTRSA